MSEGDKPFDANAFEHAKEKEKLAAAKEDLTTPVTTHEIEGVGETLVTKLDIISHGWRQTAVRLLRVLDPEAYQRYRKLKYGAGKNPDHRTRMKAYQFAVARFLEASYKIAGL